MSLVDEFTKQMPLDVVVIFDDICRKDISNDQRRQRDGSCGRFYAVIGSWVWAC